MSESEFEERLFLRYLRLLGIQKQRPSFEYLKEIVRIQVSKIPFENISKLFLKKRLNLKHLIDFELYLDGIEKYSFGGTCYSNNFYLNQLLNWLGYDIKLCGADMKNPDVHIVNIVNIENREFLVDTGYAAPFSEPLPLDLLNDYSINMGNYRYILKPQNNNNRPQIELYRNGELIHGYRVNPQARNIGEFRQVIEDSFKESATFMNALLLT
ncbi:MAG: arylamine N-acetyltransferase [Bacteroidales bacterium]|nr:arylamine N-acetyltransferase [Bacteroidales bacterium]